MAKAYSDLYAQMDSYVGEILKYKSQALSEMKIEMDGDEMGKFVDRTVTNLVYA